MKNAYKIIAHHNQGQAKTLTHDVPAPGSFWGPLKIKASPGARYQLVDLNTGQGPDNIRAKRVGKDLRISFEGRDKVDVMITDFYEHAGQDGLVGEVEPGVFHAYVPESGDTAQMLSRLGDGANSTGMALGRESLAAVVPGASAGALVAAAGFNPLLVAPLALLGAAAGGGGGGARDTTPPKVLGARLLADDDTGVSNSDGITSDNTPRLLISADADAVSATVTLMNGRSYTSTSKNAQGQFVVQIPDTVTDALGNGPVTYTVVVKDAAGNASEPWSGTPFVVDRVSEPLDPSPALNLTRMSQSAFDLDRSDFLTNVAQPEFEGTITNYNAATQKLLVQVLGIRGTTLDFAYVTPNATTGVWLFKPSIALAGLNDQYLFKVSLVDNAGNLLKVWDQSFGVDRVVPELVVTSERSSQSSDWGNEVKAMTSERGAFWFGDESQRTESATFTLTSALKAERGFKMGFWDRAGNASSIVSNADDPSTPAVEGGWRFAPDVLEIRLNQDSSEIELNPKSLAAAHRTPKTFGAGALVGSVGKFEFERGQETEVNLVDRYPLTPGLNAVSALNHIVMTDGVGNDTIKLTMGDVLALGVKDSFLSNGRRQMRIDGDAGDKVILDDLFGGSSYTWSKASDPVALSSSNYEVYSNPTLGLDLFIQQVINAQLI